MKEQRIIVEIDGEGRVSAQADGFAGDACLKELEKLLENLAARCEEIDRNADPGQRTATAREEQQIIKGTKR